MRRVKTLVRVLSFGLIAPLCASAANYCIKVNGGFGNGGTSFVGKGFAVPAAGACSPWSGFVKTSSTVIANSTGAGCLSSDARVLTLTIFSTDPSWFGPGNFGTDHIRLCPAGVTNCPLGGGSDAGSFSGPASPQACTTKLLSLPALHD
jgi:hypothetical protein